MHVPVMIVGAIVTGVSLAITLVAGHLKSNKMIVFKMVASTGFLAVAVASGAFGLRYGQIVFAGLVLCWYGDFALAMKGQAWFLSGLVSFLLGHLAFVAAFLLRGVTATFALGALVVLLVAAGIVLRWVYPHLPGEMRIPVLAYITVISVMVMFAVGTQGVTVNPLILAGAVVFYVSDIFVARDRFVNPGFSNTLIGLPLYYTGVVLIAFSIAPEIAAL